MTMTHTQIQGAIDRLTEQRNAALNAEVVLAGELAEARSRIELLQQQLDAANALLAEHAEVAPPEVPHG